MTNLPSAAPSAPPASLSTSFAGAAKNLISSTAELLLHKFAERVADSTRADVFPAAQRVAQDAIAAGVGVEHAAFRAGVAAAEKVLEKDPDTFWEKVLRPKEPRVFGSLRNEPAHDTGKRGAVGPKGRRDWRRAWHGAAVYR